MRYCVQCGKMVPDGATLCQDCQAKNMPVQPVAAVKQKPKVRKIWIGLGIAAVVVVAVVLVLVALFRPRDLRMEDFQRVNGFTAYFHYGVPDQSGTDNSGYDLDYFDNVTFYGITPLLFSVKPDENRVTFLFDDADAEDVVDTIIEHCDYDRNIAGMFYYFSYDNLEISVDSSGTFLSITIN